jgi:hypothetical protein
MQIVSTESCVSCLSVQLFDTEQNIYLNPPPHRPPGSATIIFLFVTKKGGAHLSVSCLICCGSGASVRCISTPQDSEINQTKPTWQFYVTSGQCSGLSRNFITEPDRACWHHINWPFYYPYIATHLPKHCKTRSRSPILDVHIAVYEFFSDILVSTWWWPT